MNDTFLHTYDAEDLFAGPGGWDEAGKNLGLKILGYEWDATACLTRRAAGHPTVEGDVRDSSPLPYTKGLIASPPCQTFSTAGKGSGREEMAKVTEAVLAVDLGATFADERTGLVLEPLGWAYQRYEEGNPYEWLAFEQVPTVLPIWEAYAEVLRSIGYNVWTGCLQAEMFGVPQTRKRAFLIARLHQPVSPPVPTHSRYYPRDPKRLDSGVKSWVSMATALEWGMSERPSMTVCAGGTKTGGAEVFGNGARQGMQREREREAWVVRGE